MFFGNQKLKKDSPNYLLYVVSFFCVLISIKFTKIDSIEVAQKKN
jgi:hypothetical protein